MCDFKPGDEVVCVKSRTGELIVGRSYVISTVGPPVPNQSWEKHPSVRLANGPDFYGEVRQRPDGSRYRWVGWCATCFRKVQRKKTDLSIEAFSVIKPGFEEPKRAPAPARKREGV